MSSIADSSAIIQSSTLEVPHPPSWFGEVVFIATHLRKQGALSQTCERVRFARPRFGRYDMLDFLAVLFGYAISGERTLEAFYEALTPVCSSIHGPLWARPDALALRPLALCRAIVPTQQAMSSVLDQMDANQITMFLVLNTPPEA